ncbi:SEC-C metal-binding domain-containing protein [Alkalicoccus luteus]|uniref:SEC-C metal-binding domain-containing protein n=1 Tax=Alkalicoccus luteus TaxID=1237094 RepID=UPI0040345D5C
MEVKLDAEVAQQVERMDWEAVFTDSSAPASLMETLMRYTRRELDHLRKLAAVKGFSKLNKAALAEALREHALHQITDVLMKADSRRANVLQQLAADGVYDVADINDLHFVHIEYLQQLYFIRAVRESERFYLAVSPDVQQRMQEVLKENPEFSAVWERNDIICGTALGCAVHYGVVTVPTYVAMVQRALPDADESTILGIFEEFTYWNPYEVFLEDGLLAQTELTLPNRDPLGLLEEQFSRPIGYAEVAPELLASYQDSAGPADTAPVRKFAAFMENTLGIEKEEAWKDAALLEHSFRMGDSFNEEAVEFVERFEIADDQDAAKTMAAMQQLYNHTKQWMLKGYAPVEMPNPAAAKSPVVSKVSRNAPCPCGSGKKYKKCCGA